MGWPSNISDFISKLQTSHTISFPVVRGSNAEQSGQNDRFDREKQATQVFGGSGSRVLFRGSFSACFVAFPFSFTFSFPLSPFCCELALVGVGFVVVFLDFCVSFAFSFCSSFRRSFLLFRGTSSSSLFLFFVLVPVCFSITAFPFFSLDGVSGIPRIFCNSKTATRKNPAKLRLAQPKLMQMESTVGQPRPHENGEPEQPPPVEHRMNGHGTGEKEENGLIPVQRNEQSFNFLEKALGGPKHFLAPMVILGVASIEEIGINFLLRLIRWT